MKHPLATRHIAWLLALPLLLAGCLPISLAPLEPFTTYSFNSSEFNDRDRLQNACVVPAAASFWCDALPSELVRVPTKGIDLVFSEAGEVMAAFAKFQRGQGLPGYSVENRDNLVSSLSPIPGGALLLDGVYHAPENASGSWEKLDDTTLRGRFTYTAAGLDVELVVDVSNVTQVLAYDVLVRVPAAAPEGLALPSRVQFAVAGVGRADPPTIKIGQGEAFSLNPLAQPVDRPTYISLQTNNRETDNAIVLTAGSGADVRMQAISLGDRKIAMQLPFEQEARLRVNAYFGKNELVRFYQEGLDTLPGLFTPNLLGRMSLWVLIGLEFIHQYVNNWALSIIVLTLIFRALVWPLITTQTKSMFGMQRLQPELQRLQKKYKDDREKLTQETMKLYKDAGVNPAGGCLPIFIQMPLFIILWRVFVNFEFNEGFVWIPDLGLPDPWYILPALYVLVMVGMSYFSARGNPQMLRQSMLINLVFVFIMVTFPAGVLLYFVVSMGVQVFQYWLLSRNQPVPAATKA